MINDKERGDLFELVASGDYGLKLPVKQAALLNRLINEPAGLMFIDQPLGDRVGRLLVKDLHKEMRILRETLKQFFHDHPIGQQSRYSLTVSRGRDKRYHLKIDANPTRFKITPDGKLVPLGSWGLNSVFLCHCISDKQSVRQLHNKLTGYGLKPWLDEIDLIAGQDWDTEIKKAVRASDIVLVCLSKASITKSGYVQKEIKFALDVADEKPEGTIYIIPARLEECTIPERLSKWHCLDLFRPNGFENLVRAITHKVEQKR